MNLLSRPTCACILLAACLALLPAGYAQSQANTQDTFHIHGVVLDSHTGKPISRVVVEAYNGRLATFTDHDGRFALTMHFTPVNGAATGQFQRGLLNAGFLYLGLSVRKPGYSQDNTQRQLQRVSVSALDNDLVVKLIPESTIQGRIATPSDDRPEGIRVSLLMRRIQEGSPVWGPASMAVTDSRGEFRFAGLQPGHYRLSTQDWTEDPGQANLLSLEEADKPVSRYPPTSYPATGSDADVRLTAGQTEQISLNLHPQAYVPIRIPVALPDGSSPGIGVRVRRLGTLENIQSGLALRYLPREKAVRGILPAGQYEVTLNANGAGGPATAGLVAVVSLTVGGSRVETAPVTLLAPASIPVIIHQNLTKAVQNNAAATSGGGIAGRLQGIVTAGIGGHGDDLPSPIQVLLVPPPGTSQTVFARRPNGAEDVVLEPVPPGSYRMEANTPNGYIAAATSGNTDLLRQPLIVTPGSSVEPIEITVRDDTATVHGTLDSALLNANSPGIEAAGSPSDLGGFEQIDPSNIVLVTCIPTQPNGQRLMQGFVLRDGVFTVNNLPPGSYRVYASRMPLESLEYQSESFTRDYGSKGQSVTLEPNGNATVTLTSIIEELKDP